MALHIRAVVEQIYKRLMMELEQRVQALEQELQILKNQIQALLLDIQEQVLSNTYPDLRSGDVPPVDNRSASRPQSEPEPQKRPSSPVHKVSFTNEEKPAAPPPQPHDALLPDMAGLEAWAVQKMETIGVPETLDMIRMYGTNGRFSPEVQDALLEFVSLNGNYPDSPTQPSRSAVVNAVPAAPQHKPVKKTPPPVRSVPAEPPPNPAKPPKVKASAPPSNHKGKAVKPKVEVKSPPVGENTHNVVLKLIAGVQNAGAGVRWGKRNG